MDYEDIKARLAAGGEEALVDARVRKLLWASVGVTVLLYAIPFGRLVAYPLLLFSTLVHELGHGVTAVFMGGRFEQFVMFADGSGVAQSFGSFSPGQSAAIAAGGLVGPAVLAMIGFVAARRAKAARVILGLGAVALLVAEIAVVRNPFGLVFVGVCIVAMGWVTWRGTPISAQTAVVFMAVQLSLSVFSTGDYLFVEVAETGAGDMPSDVANMATALGGPYWVWGLACGGFSILALCLGIYVYLRGLPWARRKK